MPSAVKVVFDADTGAFRASVDGATAAVQKQADAVAATKNKIADATKANIEAAKNQGASTEELVRIATRGADAIGSVTEKNAERVSAAYDRMAEKAKSTAATLNNLKFDTQGNDGHGVTNQQKVSALVRGGGVRSAENFLTQFDAVNKFAGIVFPVLGAAQLAKELFHVGEEAKQAYDEAQRLPEAIRDGFESLNAPLEANVDHMRVVNDQLEITNAHLHGGSAQKPIAALEIDMIAEAADKAAAESRKAYMDVKKLLDENKSGAFGRLLDKGDTGDVSNEIQKQMKGLADLDREHERNIHEGRSDDGEKKEYERRRKSLEDAQREYIRATRDKINNSYVDDVHTSASGVTSINRMTYAQRYGDQSAVNNILDGYEDRLNARDDGRTEEARNTQDQLENKRLTDARNRASAAKSAASKAASEAQKAKRDEINAMNALWKQEDDDLRNAGDVTAAMEVALWVQRIGALNKGSKGYAEEYATAEHNLSEARVRARKQEEADAKARAELLDRGQMSSFSEQRVDAQSNGATPQALKQLAEIQMMMANSSNRVAAQKNLDDATKAAQRYADAAQKASDKAKEAAQQEASAYQLASIQLAVSTGQMSKYDAATETANVHAAQYATTLAALKKALAEAQLKDPNGADAVNAQAAIDKAVAERKVQIMEDAANSAAQTWQGALKNANALWIQDSRDSAKQVQEIFQQTLDSVNNDLVNALTEKHHHGDHAIRNSFADTARGVSRTIANAGLKRAESGIMKSLGLGGKADGSKSNPFHVIMADGDKALSKGVDGLKSLFGNKSGDTDSDNSGSSGLGGLFHKGINFLASMFGGPGGQSFAVGGDVQGPAGGWSAINVGEMGRETVTVPNGSHITPHDQLSSQAAAYTINVGQGVTSEQVHMQVSRALKTVHPQVMRDAVKAVKSSQARRPSNSR